jgi:hypothetical protein
MVERMRYGSLFVGQNFVGDLSAMLNDSDKRAIVIWALLVGLVSLGFSFMVPLRPQGTDTVAGRLSALTLACAGNHDLAEMPWLKSGVSLEQPPYFLRTTADKKGWVSTFGPGPAWVGQLAAWNLEDGTSLDDQIIRKRTRVVATLLAVLAGLLLYVALLAAQPPRISAFGAMAATLSFAGVSTLGQGLWQQTAALVPLLLVCAAASWGHRYAWALLVASVSAVGGAWLRPPDLAIFGSLLLYAWMVHQKAGWNKKWWIASGVGGLIASIPFIRWNLLYHDSLLFLGQVSANEQIGGGSAFQSFGLGWVEGWAGLVFSPGRGLLFFAPIALVGLFYAWQLKKERLICIGLCVQFLLCGVFVKWWGGLGFGPRLLAFFVWVSVWIAFLHYDSYKQNVRRFVCLCASVTIVVGLVGGWRYNPLAWDIPNKSDSNPSVFWQADGPLVDVFFRAHGDNLVYFDSDPGPFVYCDPEPLRKITETPLPPVFR